MASEAIEAAEVTTAEFLFTAKLTEADVGGGSRADDRTAVVVTVVGAPVTGFAGLVTGVLEDTRLGLVTGAVEVFSEHEELISVTSSAKETCAPPLCATFKAENNKIENWIIY